MTLHEPRQHEDGVGCACGREWPHTDARPKSPHRRTGPLAHNALPLLLDVVDAARAVVSVKVLDGRPEVVALYRALKALDAEQ